MRLTLLLLLSAALPSGSTAQTAAQDIQGVWQAVSLHDGGRTAPDEVTSSIRWTVAADRITQDAEGSSMELLYKLDVTQSPIWVDLVQGGDVAMGILRIEGDTLTVCWSEARGAGRSTAFESQADGPNDVLIVFERR